MNNRKNQETDYRQRRCDHLLFCWAKYFETKTRETGPLSDVVLNFFNRFFNNNQLKVF